MCKSNSTRSQNVTESISPIIHDDVLAELTGSREIVFKPFSDTSASTGIPKQVQHEQTISHDKPWREVIKRKIDDGRSDNENIL